MPRFLVLSWVHTQAKLTSNLLQVHYKRGKSIIRRQRLSPAYILQVKR